MINIALSIGLHHTTRIMLLFYWTYIIELLFKKKQTKKTIFKVIFVWSKTLLRIDKNNRKTSNKNYFKIRGVKKKNYSNEVDIIKFK